MEYQDNKLGAPEVLTDEMFDKAKKCLVASLSIQGTCRVLGIARSTWYLWKKKAEAKDIPEHKFYREDLMRYKYPEKFQADTLGKITRMRFEEQKKRGWHDEV